MTRTPEGRGGPWLVAGGALLWGTWALFLRPAGLTGAQNAFLVLAVFSLAIPFSLRGAQLGDRGAWAALGIIGLADAGNIFFYFDALGRGPISVAVLTHYLAPLFVALAAPWFGEARSRRALLAAPVSLLGLAVLLGTPGAGTLPWMTALEGAASAVFYAAIVFGAKRAGRSFSPLAISALHGPVSLAVLLVVFGRGALPFATGTALLPLASIGRVMAGGAFCGLFACALFYAGLRRVPAQVAGSLAYLEPVSAVVVGAMFFAEPLSAVGLVGAAVVLASGLFVALEKSAPPEPALVGSTPSGTV